MKFLPCCRSVSKDITPVGGSQECWACFNVFDGQINREVIYISRCTSYTSTDASSVRLMMAQDVKLVEQLFERAVSCVEALAEHKIRHSGNDGYSLIWLGWPSLQAHVLFILPQVPPQSDIH